MLLPNLSSVLLDPEYWGDPEVFRPERFLDSEGNLVKEERFIPFGLGKPRRILSSHMLNKIKILFLL
jgi:methyl farnesoate epoxidase/farnesoate epoxidase